MRIKCYLFFVSFFYSINVLASVSPDETVIMFEDEEFFNETTHFFDTDNDDTDDVVFRTNAPEGFSVGPSLRPEPIDFPPFFDAASGGALFGTTNSTPDLRIDFLEGAVGSIGFDYLTDRPTTGVLQIFNQNNEQLASTVFASEFSPIETDIETDNFEILFFFPEGRVDLAFDEIAAYAIIDFNDEVLPDSEFEIGASIYEIDNVTFTSAETEINLIGTDADNPVLPDPFDPNNPEFQFEITILEEGLGIDFPIFIDPDIAVGYNYTVNSGPNVIEVLIPDVLPNGDGDFIIVVNGVSYPISAGNPFNIFDNTGITGGVDAFTILDISTEEALDPADDMAFVTGLTFAGAGTADITQAAIIVSVPEPGVWLLLSVGMMAVFTSRSKQLKN